MASALACDLTVFTPAERSRYDELRSGLFGGRVEEVEDGYVLHLPGDDETFRAVAEWVLLERRCCPFLGMKLDLAEPARGLRVALTGSAEVKEILRAELGSRIVLPVDSLVRR
ncbi:MAG: hypothetical protein ACRENE_07820 [Polyangiaceae bacterium]